MWQKKKDYYSEAVCSEQAKGSSVPHTPADISDPKSLICAAKKLRQEGSLDINGILSYSQLLQTHFREMLFQSSPASYKAAF